MPCQNEPSATPDLDTSGLSDQQISALAAKARAGDFFAGTDNPAAYDEDADLVQALDEPPAA